MRHHLSVSPISFIPKSPICMPLMGDLDGQRDVVEAEDDFVRDLKGVALLGDPIVGVEIVTLDERGPGAVAARALPSPNEPTPAARAAHNLTHAKSEDWCPFCVS